MLAVDLEAERRALEDIHAAASEKLERFRNLDAVGADALAVEYVDSVVRGAIEQLQRDLVVFGRIDDAESWRIGLYGVDRGGSQVVIDWRAPFAEGFYQAGFDDPRGLAGRVSYVGAIDELFIEDFQSGEASGSSPLMKELERSRGETMRTAVATLQSEQDELVRLDPDARLVLRGGPGTGKTVVGLHRAAWLVYNDRRVYAADRMLVIGPSDKYLEYVSSVLPTLGEAKIKQSTFDRLLGPSSEIGGRPEWPDILDRFEASLYAPQELAIGYKRVGEEAVTAITDRISAAKAPWRDRRTALVHALAREFDKPVAEVRAVAADVMPPCSARQAWKKLRSKPVLTGLGLDTDFIDAWLAIEEDGPIFDELKARFEEAPPKYSHAIVDEAQDISVMKLRAVERRSKGLTFVGDDAQVSEPGALGLRAIAASVGVEPSELRTAYRMSSEIADWLNEWAVAHGLPAVELLGIRPTGVPVAQTDSLDAAEREAVNSARSWMRIDHESVWTHKGIEYDIVIVDGRDMNPAEVYLAASRAAHELVLYEVTPGAVTSDPTSSSWPCLLYTSPSPRDS